MVAVDAAGLSAVEASFHLLAAADPTGVLVAVQPKLKIKLSLRHGGFEFFKCCQNYSGFVSMLTTSVARDTTIISI